MKKSIFSLAILAILFVSCQTEKQDMIEDGMPAPEIIASVETNSATRTLISVDEEGEGTIYWTPADQINIFYGTTSTLYTSQNTENATTAVFLTSAIIGSTESASTNIWGLYPYDEDAVCSGTAVTTTLPAAQYGIPGTFDDDLYITLAHSTSNALKFFNVCGGIKFSLSREDITSVSFRGNNNEDIAGDISLTFDNDLPKATVVNGVKEVTLTPKTGQTFAKEVNYYLILLPGTLSGGFTMTFTTSNGAVGTFNYTANPIIIKRSIFSKKAEIDTYATFEETQPIFPIDFNPDAYIIYRANKTEYTSGRDWYSIESHMPGISGAKVEMKFQLAEGEQKTLACDNTGSDYSCSKLEIKNGNVIWSNWDDDDDECFSYSISLSSCGLSETDLIVLSYDSVNSSFSLNNHSQTCQYGEMSFGHLFVEYYSEYDEGRRTSYTGVPDGSKLYYVKVWNENDVLTYLGYAAESINPSTNQLEYCWCSYNPITNIITYDFANDALHQGGYSGYLQPNIPAAVDLGLSVKWASFNLGASKPEDYGDYFAWGETSPKETYTPDNYLWYESGSWTSNNLVLTKYTTLPATLTLEDDAAYVNWGSSWRMPTFTEQTELRTQCDWTYTSVNEVTGWRVSSRSNGNSIFLPDANSMWYNRYYNNSPRGVYLSSTLFSVTMAYTLDLMPDSGSSRDVYYYYVTRFEGVPIRAVQD